MKLTLIDNGDDTWTVVAEDIAHDVTYSHGPLSDIEAARCPEHYGRHNV